MELIQDTAVAVIRRFDRTGGGGRIPYVSAATMLQTSGRDEDHAYTELVDKKVEVEKVVIKPVELEKIVDKIV